MGFGGFFQIALKRRRNHYVAICVWRFKAILENPPKPMIEVLLWYFTYLLNSGPVGGHRCHDS